MKYRNTETGVVWTEDEIRKGYTDLREEMDTKWNSFEEYLAFLLRNGDLEETSHTKYEVIWNTDDCCDGFYFEAATEEKAKDLLREMYSDWMTAEQANWKKPEPTPEEIENWNYMISEYYCYLIPDDAEDEEDEIWLTGEELEEIGWIEMEEK